MQVTPSFIITFQSELRGLITGNWQRVQQHLYWDRVMKKRPMNTKHQLLTWLLETARLYNEGDGGNTRFDDIIAATHALTVEDFGGGLRLTKQELEDNQMANNPAVGALDFGRKWATDMGAVQAYHPQEQLITLIKGGTTLKGYDGKTFFAADHPVSGRADDTSMGTYSNIITGVQINAEPAGAQTELDALIIAQKRWAAVLSAVAGQKFFNGVPRYLKVKYVICPTNLAYRFRQILTGSLLAQSTNVQATTDIEVFEEPQLNSEPNVFYVGVEDMMSDDMGGFIFGEREPYVMRSYNWADYPKLMLMDEYFWKMKGRDVSTYGHPYMFFRCTA